MKRLRRLGRGWAMGSVWGWGSGRLVRCAWRVWSVEVGGVDWRRPVGRTVRPGHRGRKGEGAWAMVCGVVQAGTKGTALGGQRRRLRWVAPHGDCFPRGD